MAEAGITGLGETYGDAAHLQRLQLAAAAVRGADATNTSELRRRITRALAADTTQGGHGMSGMVTGTATADRVLSPFDVASLDVQGHLLNVPVSALLGGAVREAVPFSGYLFYKWAGHPGAEPDRFGVALDPAGVVEQARWLVDTYGFTALKLKAGVFAPEAECEAIEALAAKFPDLPLRIDPNSAWSVETSVKVAERLSGVLEYLEDPTPGIEGMAEVRRRTGMKLATNMCVVSFTNIPRRCRPRPWTWCSPTTTSGAGCFARRCSAAAPRPSGGVCPCTPTAIWASAWPRWSTWPQPPRMGTTAATPTPRGRNRKTTWWFLALWRSVRTLWLFPPARPGCPARR